MKRDLKMAKHYYKLAAIGGDVMARFDLGCFEKQEGNMNRALKHWHIAAECGHVDSLHCIREMYSDGHATKEDYGRTLQAYSTYLDDVKSDQRDRTEVSYLFSYSQSYTCVMECEDIREHAEFTDFNVCCICRPNAIIFVV